MAIALSIVSAVVEKDQPQARYGGSSSSGNEYVDWSVGNCVAGSSFLVPVRCGYPHPGRIVDRVSSPGSCTYTADSWVEDLGSVYCIDEDR